MAAGLGWEGSVRVMRVVHETISSPYETAVWEEVRQEGLREGRRAAAREMLLGILTARSGPCDGATLRAMEALSDGSG